MKLASSTYLMWDTVNDREWCSGGGDFLYLIKLELETHFAVYRLEFEDKIRIGVRSTLDAAKTLCAEDFIVWCWGRQ